MTPSTAITIPTWRRPMTGVSTSRNAKNVISPPMIMTAPTTSCHPCLLMFSSSSVQLYGTNVQESDVLVKSATTPFLQRRQHEPSRSENQCPRVQDRNESASSKVLRPYVQHCGLPFDDEFLDVDPMLWIFKTEDPPCKSLAPGGCPLID